MSQLFSPSANTTVRIVLAAAGALLTAIETLK